MGGNSCVICWLTEQFDMTSKLWFDPFVGFLWQLLCEVASQHGYSRQSMGVQTDPTRLPTPASLGQSSSTVGTALLNTKAFTPTVLFFVNASCVKCQSFVTVELHTASASLSQSSTVSLVIKYHW